MSRTLFFSAFWINVSAHVLNEINCAFERFKNHEDIVLLPFRLDNCNLSDDVYYTTQIRYVLSIWHVAPKKIFCCIALVGRKAPDPDERCGIMVSFYRVDFLACFQ